MHIIDEHYHIYNRGAHKAPIFQDETDYNRFLTLLYITNNRLPLPSKWGRLNIWSEIKRDPLVDIFAYCLMPNHFHIGVVEKKDFGIEKFIHRLCTAYSMYYNRKYSHSGTIFQGQYRSKHIRDDYLKYLIQYIHLNPYGIEESDLMKASKHEQLDEAVALSEEYEYSSYQDYLGKIRPQNAIIVPRPILIRPTLGRVGLG